MECRVNRRTGDRISVIGLGTGICWSFSMRQRRNGIIPYLVPIHLWKWQQTIIRIWSFMRIPASGAGIANHVVRSM